MICVCTLLVGCSTSHSDISKKEFNTTQVDIAQLAEGKQLLVQEVKEAELEVKVPNELPEFNKENEGSLGWDLRHLDLSSFNLSDNNDLRSAVFDTSTKWPAELPANFVPNTILEAGKNPGLGVRELHSQGITGKGINIAVIGEAPLLTHEGYKDQLKLYETLHSADQESTFLGTATASLIVGKQNGVAPDANLYYIASTFEDYDEKTGTSELNLNYMADAIDRVLEINEGLPQNQKIRVLAIGRNMDNKGKDDEIRVNESIQAAMKEGIFVVTPSLATHYDMNLVGLSRAVDKSPESKDNYRIGSWENITYVGDKPLYVPKDARTVADYTSPTGYQFIPVGGDSFTVAYLAGLYALSAQAFPTLTSDRFLRYLTAFSDTLTIKDDGPTYVLRNVVNPLDAVNGLKAAVGVVQ